MGGEKFQVEIYYFVHHQFDYHSEWTLSVAEVLRISLRNLNLASMRVNNRNFVLVFIIALRGQIKFQCEHR